MLYSRSPASPTPGEMYPLLVSTSSMAAMKIWEEGREEGEDGGQPLSLIADHCRGSLELLLTSSSGNAF